MGASIGGGVFCRNDGFVWFSNGYWDSNVDNHTTSGLFTTGIINAVSNWASHDRLAPNYQPTANHASNEIHYYDGNYGFGAPLGIAYVYDDGESCPGYSCTVANYGSVLLNTRQYNPWPGYYAASFQQQRTAAHELGHIYALNHAACSSILGIYGLMSPSQCQNMWYPYVQPPSNTYTAHDSGHIDSLYD